MSGQFVIRPDQQEAVDNIVDRLKTENRTQAIMACGTGKTFTAQRAAEQITADNPDSVVLVAVPNLVLVEQLMGEWSRQSNSGFEFASLAVNSRREKPVRRNDMEEDEITSVSIDGVTSDPERIAAFMLAPGRKVIFSTYQSMDKIASAATLARGSVPGFELDLAVADEAHRTAGVATAEKKSNFKLILDGFEIPVRKRLFMTATPRISKPKSKGDSDTAAFSMGNPDVYGDRAITRSLSWAVAKELLVPYRTYVTQVSDADLHSVIARNKTLRLDGTAAQARQIAAAITLAKNAAQNELGGIITYHSSIAGAQEFTKILRAVVEALPAGQKPTGRLTINHVNGSTASEERSRALGMLSSSSREPGDWSVVTNCNCLVEGVNVPSMDAIMLVDPRKSVVSIVQAIGRPMRIDANKPDKVANILLPVFVGEHENAEDALSSGAFEGVYQTIKALRDVDDALSEKFVEALVNRSQEPVETPEPVAGESAEIVVEGDVGAAATSEASEREVPLLVVTDSEGTPLPGQPSDGIIHIAAPSSASSVQKLSREVGREAAGKFLDQHWSAWHSSLEAKLIEDNADSWERGVAALTSYVRRSGSATIPYSAVENGFNLGSWVRTLRVNYRAGKLTPDRITQIERIVAGWVWDPFAAEWAAGISALESFVRREGHANVPSRFIEDGFALGTWVSSRRNHRKNGNLSEDRAGQLESFPGWSWGRTSLDAWLAGLSALEAFVRQYGHADVPTDFMHEGLNLGGWVRKRCRDRDIGRLSVEKARKLESMPGWKWTESMEQKWEVVFEALMTFATRYGHLQIPKNHREGDVNLSNWVWWQQAAKRKDSLPAERARRLETVPEWTWGKTTAEMWDENTATLRSYIERNGDVSVPCSHTESGRALGSWAKKCRARLIAGKLSLERIAELDAISVSWRNGKLAPWESAFGVKACSDMDLSQAA